MRLFLEVPAWRRILAAGCAVGAVFAVAGCDSASRGSGQTPMRGIASILMGPPGGGESDLQGQRPDAPGGPRCPIIVVRDGTETLRRYDRGFEDDPGRLVYQGSVTRTARECVFHDDRTVSIKFGIAGRLITGPSGKPGSYELPLRVAFVPVGAEPVWTQLYRVPVTIRPGETSAQFTYIEENLSYTLPEGQSFGSHIIFVGFDELT